MDHTNPTDTCAACKAIRVSLRCNCGAAEQGHSPDCEYVRGTDALQEEHDDDIASRQPSPCSLCGAPDYMECPCPSEAY